MISVSGGLVIVLHTKQIHRKLPFLLHRKNLEENFRFVYGVDARRFVARKGDFAFGLCLHNPKAPG
jgi:hypothetical protein